MQISITPPRVNIHSILYSASSFYCTAISYQQYCYVDKIKRMFLDFDVSRKNKRKEDIASKSKDVLNRRTRQAEEEAKIVLRDSNEVKKKQASLEQSRKRTLKLAEKLHERKTGGIKVRKVLSPYALTTENSNKLILPPSILDDLLKQNVLETRNLETQPLTFELTLTLKSGETSSTVCGVAEFSANEGTVGVPLKTALSLVKSNPVEVLATSDVEVSFVKVEEYKNMVLGLRPKGRGFFTAGEDDVVELDIRRILETVLNKAVVLSLNDVLPLFDPAKGNSFLLQVVELRPRDKSAVELEEVIEIESEEEDTELFLRYAPTSFLVLNSHVEVDILPSEVAQNKIDVDRRRAELASKVETKLNRLKDAYEKVDLSGNENVSFRIKLPNNATETKKFSLGCRVVEVLNWIRYELCNVVVSAAEVDLSLVLEQDYFFKVVQPFGNPGQEVRLEPAFADSTLKQIELQPRGYSLVVILPKLVPKRDDTSNPVMESLTYGSNPWSAAFQHFREIGETTDELTPGLDLIRDPVRLETPDELNRADSKRDDRIEAHYADLVEKHGVDPDLARTVSHSYWESLEQLREMGFEDRFFEACGLLVKYQGRVVRVANALVGNT